MAELLFPVAAVSVTFLIAVPALTFVSRVVLTFSRRRSSSWASFGSDATFAWLVAPTLLPVLWVTSSAIHQSEPTRAGNSCLVERVESASCVDTLLLLTLMLGGMTVLIGFRLWREWPRISLQRLASDHELARRVSIMVEDDAHLRGLNVVVIQASEEPIYTLGLARPVVVVDACFVRSTDAEVLRASLLHERAHIAGYDTLRSFVVRFCLSANPAGAWLEPDFERWRNAREARCDDYAVRHGGEPLALAEGILRAARFRCIELCANAVALCGYSATALKLRIALLTSGTTRPRRTRGDLALLLAVVAVLGAPHLGNAGLLHHFHIEVETLLQGPS